jgi:hypothetical protein
MGNLRVTESSIRGRCLSDFSDLTGLTKSSVLKEEIRLKVVISFIFLRLVPTYYYIYA